MEMVAHEGVGIAWCLCVELDGAESVEKVMLVVVCVEYVPAFYAPHLNKVSRNDRNRTASVSAAEIGRS